MLFRSAIGPDGSAYFTGGISASDLQAIPGASVLSNSSGGGAFVIKLNPSGDRISYATFLGSGIGYAITVDSQGSAYVTGMTFDPNYPATPGAYQTQCGCSSSSGGTVFITKLNATGTGAVYSTFVQAAGTSPFTADSVAPLSIDVNDAGEVRLLSMKGGTILYAKRLDPLGGGLVSDVSATVPGTAVTSAMLDSLGRILMTGKIVSPAFNPSSGGFNVTMSGTVTAISNSGPAVVTVPGSLSLAGAGPLTITLSGASGAGWTAVNGTFQCIRIAANACAVPINSSQFGTLAGAVHFAISASATFFAVADSDGTLLYSTALPYATGGTGIAPDANGGFLVLGSSHLSNKVSMPSPAFHDFWTATRFVPDSVARPAILAIANSAESNLNTVIAPGELLTVYGMNIGPPATVNAEFDSNGNLPVELAGVSVELNGILAPILSVGFQQATVVVPFRFCDGDTANILIHSNELMSNTQQMPVRAAEPQIFGSGPDYPLDVSNALALNEDGSLNSYDNPAPGGSIVTIFLNGAGVLGPLPPQGTSGTLGQTPILPVSASYSVEYDIRYSRAPAPLQILYAGGSPGLLAGLIQINFRMPPALALSSIQVHINVGDAVTSANIFIPLH